MLIWDGQSDLGPLLVNGSSECLVDYIDEEKQKLVWDRHNNTDKEDHPGLRVTIWNSKFWKLVYAASVQTPNISL